MPLETDRELVEAVLAERPGAFTRLVFVHQRLCWHVISRLVKHSGEAEELCQETFLRVHRQLHQFRFESGLRTWIGRVAWSVALRHLERKRVPLVDFGANDPDDAPDWTEGRPGAYNVETDYEQAQIHRLVRAQLEALAPLPRTLLMLYHLEELPIPEIAELTGLPIGTIKSHLSRGRLRLRERLLHLLGDSP